MNGRNNDHNYGPYKIENMLPIHRVQNGHKLQEQLKTACFEVFMMTGLKKQPSWADLPVTLRWLY
jgi:hypothetical protein